MNEEMYEKLNKTESYHWWFRAKREIVIGLAKPYLKNCKHEEIRLADMGCGTGLMLSELEKYGLTTGYDFSEVALSYCKKKSNAKLIQLDLGDAKFIPTDTYEVVLALDIIEHIKDDEVAMNNIYKSVKNGGYAIITTPAFQWLWSQNDINNMHYRRYSLKKIKDLAERNGFTIEYISYFNFWLFIPIALVRLVCKFFGIDKHSSIEYNSGNGIVNDILFRIFRSEEKRISKHKKFPFGISLIMLVSKD